jgi:hypothetical protein
MRRQLRAHVSIDTGGVVTLSGQNLHATMEIKNSGPTPAYEVSINSILFMQEINASPSEPPVKDVDLAKTTVGPGATVSVEAQLFVRNVHDLHGLSVGDIIPWVTGRIRYRNVFGHSRGIDFLLRGDASPDRHETWILTLYRIRSGSD